MSAQGAYATSFGSGVSAEVGASASRYHSQNQAFQNHQSLPTNNEGNDMDSLWEPTPRKFRGGRTGNKQRIGTDDLADWLADVLRNKTAKDIADDAGCGIRTAENAKQGRNTLSAKHLATLQINDPDVAAAWMEYVGLIRAGEAEAAAAYTKFANAVVRRDA